MMPSALARDLVNLICLDNTKMLVITKNLAFLDKNVGKSGLPLSEIVLGYNLWSYKSLLKQI